MDGDKTRKTDAEISAELEELQRKLLTLRIVSISALVGFFASILALFSAKTDIPAITGIVCFVITAFGVFKMQKLTDKIGKIAGKGVLQQLLEEMLEDVQYSPLSHISEEDIKAADLVLNCYDTVEGNNYVKASYKGLSIEMSNIRLSDDDVDSAHVVFGGLWLICDFGRELSDDIRIVERTGLGKGLGVGGIKTANETFNKQFKVSSDNEEEALRILTPEMLDCIMKIDTQSDTRTRVAILRSGRVHYARGGKSAFKIKNGVSDAQRLRAQFTEELREVTDIIETLQLMDTLLRD